MKNKIAGMVFLGCVCMKHKAAAAPVEHYDSYRVAGTVKLSWRNYWGYGGYSSSEWLSEKTEREDTIEEGASGHIPVRSHYSRHLITVLKFFNKSIGHRGEKTPNHNIFSALHSHSPMFTKD